MSPAEKLAKERAAFRRLDADYRELFATQCKTADARRRAEDALVATMENLSAMTRKAEDTAKALDAERANRASSDQALSFQAAEISRLKARITDFEKSALTREAAITDLKTEVAELMINLARARGYIDRANEDDAIARNPHEDVSPAPTRCRQGPDIVGLGRVSQPASNAYGRPEHKHWFQL